MKKKINYIIFYDGFCKLCSASVQFILKRIKPEKFIFFPLQSEKAESYLLQNKLPKNYSKSLIVINDKQKALFKSDAALFIAKHLKGLWPLLYFFVIIPKPIRDFFYSFIANRRFKWFGKRDKCYIPPVGE